MSYEIKLTPAEHIAVLQQENETLRREREQLKQQVERHLNTIQNQRGRIKTLKRL